ncbi:MAG TPA: hypothetical protein VFO53_02685 [Casimicrobiaceae bacterium]|nr:hypothetical protein [Casimicrobiaceae bacterium]
MKRSCVSLLVLVAVLCASSALAAFHLFRVDQVYSNADGSVQYVVMREVTGSDGENFWQGNSLTTTGAGGMQQFQFPANLPSASTASRSVLVATSGFAALGLVTPDYTIPAGFVPRAGGTLNYAGVDQIALPALPADGVTAVDRNGNQVAATPKNFAGATATLTTPTPPAATAPDLDQHGLTGSWFEPATSGQGFEVEFYPDLVAAGTALVQGAWFTFEVAPAGGADRQRWYTFNGHAQSGDDDVNITIFQNVGGNFDAPPVTNGVAVGSGTLSFDTCTSGSLNYAFSDGSGRSGTIPLSRITPNVTCATGTAAPTTNADFALSGNWFDPATSGQGFVFEVNPIVSVVSFAWYTYSPTGQMAGAAGQRWFTGSASYAPGNRMIPLTLFETTGGVFDQPTPAAQTSTPVGSAVVNFTSCSTAQLQFNFTGGGNAGHAGTISLARVGPVPPGCVNSSSDASMQPGYGGGYGP